MNGGMGVHSVPWGNHFHSWGSWLKHTAVWNISHFHPPCCTWCKINAVLCFLFYKNQCLFVSSKEFSLGMHVCVCSLWDTLHLFHPSFTAFCSLPFGVIAAVSLTGFFSQVWKLISSHSVTHESSVLWLNSSCTIPWPNDEINCFNESLTLSWVKSRQEQQENREEKSV